jgi:drug/metabolite transporter (DMT)-like permease
MNHRFGFVQNISPFILLFFAILSVSTASLIIRFAQAEVPSLVIAAYRLSLATLVTAGFIRSKHIAEIRKINSRQWSILIISGLFLAFHFATWISSLEMTSVASSVVLVTTTPIWVALFSPFLLAEQITKKAALFLGIAFLGSILVTFGRTCVFSNSIFECSMASSSEMNNLAGNLLALFGAWMAAGYVMAGRKMRKILSTTSYTLVVYLVASIVLLIICFGFKLPLTGYKPSSYIWLLLLAVVPQLFGHSVINWVLGILPASIVSIALLGEPVGSTILALIIMGEIPTWIEVIGGGLIILGIILSTIKSKLKPLSNQSSSISE